MERLLKRFMKQINLNDYNDVFKNFHDWAMVTAEYNDKHNSMIIGWGHLGVVWRQDTAIVFIRENRYTYEFIEKADNFTISFYDKEKYLDGLKIYGSKSGRDYDKDLLSGFHPIRMHDMITYEEACLTIFCKKIYSIKLSDDGINDSSISEFYSYNDDGTRHHMYVGRIVDILEK